MIYFAPMTTKKIGILGGGQLGRMLLQAAANYPVDTFVMENDLACPAAHLCHHFTKGDIPILMTSIILVKGWMPLPLKLKT
jgi:hypothetical protein